MTLDEVSSGKVRIIAPGTVASFDRFAIGENIVAGNAMTRRAMYAFGNLLDLEPKQFITCVSRSVAARASQRPTSHRPTRSRKPARRDTSPCLASKFLYAPDTEAPEEMHIWIPELKALTCAENANHSLHNIQTLRGARRRDARNFTRYLNETLQRWGDGAEVHYGPHTWPVSTARSWNPPEPARHLQAHPRPGAAAGQQGAGHPWRPPR